MQQQSTTTPSITTTSTKTTTTSTTTGTKAGERARLRVLYDFEYETRGKQVKIIKDEKLLLIRKTNDDWWQVVRPADLVGSLNFYVPEQLTFFVPTGYVVEIKEEPLPESTRFYVDKDRMFNKHSTTNDQGTNSSNSSSGSSSQQSQENSKPTVTGSSREEPRKAHDSFRSVFRKLSGNLTSHVSSSSNSNNNNETPKSSKPSKVGRGQRKNSVDGGEEASSSNSKPPSGAKSILGIVPPIKHKDTVWEGSAFGMCFGRDNKNVDAQLLNPFQEELTSKVTLKKTILDNKVEIGNTSNSKHVDQVRDDTDKCGSSFENIHSKWEKVSAQVLKRDNNNSPYAPTPLAKLKEDAQKRRSASPNLQQKVESPGEANNNNSSSNSSNGKQANYSVVEKGPKKFAPVVAEKPSLEKRIAAVEDDNNKQPSTAEKTNVKSTEQESPSKEKDRLLINDKRKMWAIETLMSELMQSSSQAKTTSTSENSDERTISSGPNQLAQELHDMNRSRRFENAEIQVNLLDDKSEDFSYNNNGNDSNSTKENERPRKVFNFNFPPPPPRSSLVKAPPRSPTARSPKLLDEYNEANILNDNDRRQQQRQLRREDHKKDDVDDEDVIDDETPSYSNISLRLRRDKVPCTLKMPSKDFRDELQLTPSLEKLASEIKFLPASSAAAEQSSAALDLDCPTTTLSQDSLRLYKRRSKSDGALNKRDPRSGRRDSVASQRRNPSSASHMEITRAASNSIASSNSQSTSGLVVERKYARGSLLIVRQEALQSQERPRYSKLNRKSRSLGDLDCSDGMEEEEDDDVLLKKNKEGTTEDEAVGRRRFYKPVPKLRSKESLRRLKQFGPTSLKPAASAERLGGRPIPAKRRIQPQQQQQQLQAMCDSSYDELSEIDIDRSTAVGFKTLLRTSDSGSEEYLQYKTFPASSRAQLSPQQQQHQYQQQQHSTPKLQSSMSRSDDGNMLSRSLSSDEMILSSASCCSSSASPSRIMRDGSLENLVELPQGWTQSYDHIAKRVCFVSERGDKWFSSNDEEGKIYFFEENSNESSWALPQVVTTGSRRARTISNGDWPQLFDGNMCILKEGVIYKTKITTENGKKLRKTWSASYAVLTELFLLFFKDAKTYAAMKKDQSAAAKPDISIDLNGAFIEPGEKLSNRKNVYLINTLLGLQVLIQSDNASVISEWYRAIHDAIQRLPFSQERSSSSRD